MVGFCPACREALLPGALRCRHCNADAREAKQAVGVLIRWEDVISEKDLAALDTMDLLRAAAPGVAEWYRLATDAERKVVEGLLAEMRRLRTRPT